MSDPVIPLTFPYKPNGGFTPSEIWGTPKPSMDPVVPDGSSFESRERIKKLAVSTLEDLVNYLEVKNGIKPAPEIVSNYRDSSTYPANETGPKIFITGEAMPPPKTNWGPLFMTGLALFVVWAAVKK